MILKMAKRAFFLRKNKSEKTKRYESTAAIGAAAHEDVTVVENAFPKWEGVLTQSLKENALAPSDEVILHAYNLYCDELNAPFVKRRRAMNERFSNVIAEFAALQALAPDMIERAAAKHRLEMDRFLAKKGHNS